MILIRSGTTLLRLLFAVEHKLCSITSACYGIFQISPPSSPLVEIHKDYEFLMPRQQYVLQKNVVAE